MSNIPIQYADFDVYNYRGERSLETYSLPITPLTFVANLPSRVAGVPVNDSKVIFDFGDGTVSNDLSAVHAYKLPGVYRVRMIITSCNNERSLASYSTNVVIKDYIENTFKLQYSNPDLIVSPPIDLYANQRSSIITLTNFSPYYQELQDIQYKVIDSEVPNFFNIPTYKFNHLKKHYAFYVREPVVAYDDFEYTPVPALSVPKNKIFVKLEDGVIVHTIEEDTSAVFAGLSGKKEYYFVSDTKINASQQINISLFKDRNIVFVQSIDGYDHQDFLNTLNITLSATLNPYKVPRNISISSNGLDNEGDGVSVFRINEIQFNDSPIPFLIKPKDTNGFTIKNLSLVNTPGIYIRKYEGQNITNEVFVPLITESLSNNITTETIPLTGGNFSVVNHTPALTANVGEDYFYFGTLYFSKNIEELGEYSIAIAAEYTNGVDTFALSGTSDRFRVYPRDYYKIPKHNEDIDFSENIKDLRFQEVLLDKNILFDNFIGSIFGNISSSSSSLGKRIHEKIFNFTSNKIDYEICDTDAIKSLSNMLNESADVADTYSLNLPVNFRELISKLSTQYNKFRGEKNRFVENYDSKGRVCSEETYGVNLGERLDTSTYTVTAGTDIIAYEKFSGTYNILNTYQPVCAIGAEQYALSSYNTTWGWPLVLASDYTYDKLDDFYLFYEYIYHEEGTVMGSLIDFKNINTTFNFNTPLSSFRGTGNIEDVIVTNSLFTSLSLFSI